MKTKKIIGWLSKWRLSYGVFAMLAVLAVGEMTYHNDGVRGQRTIVEMKAPKLKL